MRGVRFVVGRLRYSNERAVQTVVFDSREFSERDARAWLLENGLKARVLQRDGRWWRSRQQEAREFDPQSFRTIETGRGEVVTMASNPKRKRRAGKKRRAPNRRATTKRRSARRRRKVSASSRSRIRMRTGLRVNARRARRRRKAKTVRTKVTTVRVMRTNARRRRRRSARSSTRYTLAFTPAAASVFARIARLSIVRRREMRRALRRHPSGGVYVALPAWHGSRDTAKRFAERVQLILAYAAGRRRASLSSSAAPRVVAVP